MGNVKKIIQLLSPVEKRQAYLLLSLIIVGMFMEMLGLGMVIPLITVIAQENIVQTYPALAPFLVSLGNPSQSELLLIVMLALVAIYTVKNIFLAYLTWKQIAFSVGIKMRISHTLFRSYLTQNYAFHLHRNSAELLRNILGEASLFGQLLTFLIYILTEGLVLLGISLLTIWVEPLGIIVIVALASVVTFFYYMTRRHVSRWGQERQFHEGLRVQHVQQGLGGVKDVLVFGRETNFVDKFKLHNLVTSRASQFNEALNKIPRLFLEMFVILGMCLLVGFMVVMDRNATEIITTLGVFAAASFRIIPSINRLVSSVQNLRFNLPVIKTISDELKEFNSITTRETSTERMIFESEIKIENITFTYPESNVPALDNVSLTIQRGKSIGIIGSSGSGKSTLVDIILGLFTPDGGNILVDGRNIQPNLRSWTNIIGYVPQTIFLTDESLRHNIAFGLADDEIDDKAVEKALNAAQLSEFVVSLDLGLDTIVGERGVRLSGGQRQRIGIARALYHNPEILILDEATSSLDTHTEKKVMESVLRLQGEKTIIIVAHRLSTIENTDLLIKLDKGIIVESGDANTILGKQLIT